MNRIQIKQIEGLTANTEGIASQVIDQRQVLFATGDQLISGIKTFHDKLYATGGLVVTGGIQSFEGNVDLFGNTYITGELWITGTDGDVFQFRPGSNVGNQFLVYVSGDQTISGQKTFTQGLYITGGSTSSADSTNIVNSALWIKSVDSTAFPTSLNQNLGLVVGKGQGSEGVEPTFSVYNYDGAESDLGGTYLGNTNLLYGSSKHLTIENPLPTGDIRFFTCGWKDAGTDSSWWNPEAQRMIISSGGRVGIGVTGVTAEGYSVEPLEMLHVSGGNFRVDGDSYLSGKLWITGTDGAPTQVFPGEGVGAGTAAGSDYQIQYNSSDAFAASSNLIFKDGVLEAAHVISGTTFTGGNFYASGNSDTNVAFQSLNSSRSETAYSEFRAVNNTGDFITYGLSSTDRTAFNIGSGNAFLWPSSNIEKFIIGNQSDLLFYADVNYASNSSNANPILTLQSSTQTMDVSGDAYFHKGLFISGQNGFEQVDDSWKPINQSFLVYKSGDQNITGVKTFENKIFGNQGFFITGDHSSYDCQIEDSHLRIYSNDGNLALVAALKETAGYPSTAIYNYYGNEDTLASNNLGKTSMLYFSNPLHANITNGTPTGDIRFFTCGYKDAGTNSAWWSPEAQRMIISSGGNVGIGVTGVTAEGYSVEPLELLHVSGGNIRVDGDIYVSGRLIITGADGSFIQITGGGGAGGGGGGGSFNQYWSGCPTDTNNANIFYSGGRVAVGFPACESTEIFEVSGDGAKITASGWTGDLQFKIQVQDDVYADQDAVGMEYMEYIPSVGARGYARTYVDTSVSAHDFHITNLFSDDASIVLTNQEVNSLTGTPKVQVGVGGIPNQTYPLSREPSPEESIAGSTHSVLDIFGATHFRSGIVDSYGSDGSSLISAGKIPLLTVTGNYRSRWYGLDPSDLGGGDPINKDYLVYITGEQDITGPKVFSSNITGRGDIVSSGQLFATGLLPLESGVGTLGLRHLPWSGLYLKSSSIYFDDQKLSMVSGNIKVDYAGATQSLASMAVVDDTSNQHILGASDNGKTLHINPGNANNTHIVLPVGDSSFNNFECTVRHMDSNSPYIGFITSDDSAIQAPATGMSSKWDWAKVYRGSSSWYVYGNNLINENPATTLPPATTAAPTTPLPTTPLPTTAPPTTMVPATTQTPTLITEGLRARFFGWNDRDAGSPWNYEASVVIPDGGVDAPSSHKVIKSSVNLPGGATVTGVIQDDGSSAYNGTPSTVVDSYGTSKRALYMGGFVDAMTFPQLQTNAYGRWDDDLAFLTGVEDYSAEHSWTMTAWIKPHADLADDTSDFKPFSLGGIGASNDRSMGLFHKMRDTEHESHLRGGASDLVFTKSLPIPTAPWEQFTFSSAWNFISISYDGGQMASAANQPCDAMLVSIGTGIPSQEQLFFYSGDGSINHGGGADTDYELKVKGSQMATRGSGPSDKVIDLSDNYATMLGRQLDGDGNMPANMAQWHGYISDFRIYNRVLATGEMMQIFTGAGNDGPA